MFQYALIATTVELTLCLACSILLWARRRQTKDRSRAVLAVVCYSCVVWSVGKYFAYIGHPDACLYTEILSPAHCIAGVLCMILFFFYPVMVMRPQWFTLWRVLLFFLPWAILAPPYLLQIPFRVLSNAGEIFTYLAEFNVWWRLLTVGIIIVYLILLQWLPFSWRESSADSRWVRRYVAAVSVMAVLYFGYQLTLWMPLHLAHQVYVGLFFVHYTYFELAVRLLPKADQTDRLDDDAAIPQAPAPSSDLWRRILFEMDRNEVWRDPELSVERLCRLVGSNKIYLQRAFADNAHTTCAEYINARRVGFIAEELRRRPNQSLQDLYFWAGYRSRQTAVRNFKELMGVSPSAYAESL